MYLCIGAIECFYAELEETYGQILVSHLLTYVTASKYGLTEPEILDLIALDKEVSCVLTVYYLSV